MKTHNLYGEYRYNVEFQRGMKKIRNGEITQFIIETDNAKYIFRKIGNFVERETHLKRDYGYAPDYIYVYYNLNGRRVCPTHLKVLIFDEDRHFMEKVCPDCDYSPEPYCIQPLEQKRSEKILEMNK